MSEGIIPVVSRVAGAESEAIASVVEKEAVLPEIAPQVIAAIEPRSEAIVLGSKDFPKC
jgi:hypothetical protein